MNNITSEECNEIINLFEVDEDRFMNEVQNMLVRYTNKYKNINLKDRESLFRKDTKNIFGLLNNTFGSTKIIDDMNNALKDDDDQEEKEKYINFINNIKYIYEFIDNIDLLNPESDFTNKCSDVIEYLQKTQQDMNELSNTMMDMKNQMNELNTLLEAINVKNKTD